MVMGMAVRGDCPYRACITHGFTLDSEGHAMHTSLGNVVHPKDIVEKYGADVLRLWVGSADYTVDIRMGDEILERLVESYRKIRNTFRFLLGNLSDFDPVADRVPYDDLLPLDRYMLHRLEEFKAEITRFYDEYEFHRVFHRTYNFVVVDLSAFYLDALKDRLYTAYRDSRARRGAQTVMHDILRTLVVVLAPILPHTSDEVLKHMRGTHPDGALFEPWPSPVPEHLKDALAEDFDRLLEVREAVFAGLERMRKDEKLINDRLQARVSVLAKDPDLRDTLKRYETHLPELFIVSQVELVDAETPGLPLVHEAEGLWVGLEKAHGEKCPRCWMYSPEVGTDGEYPDLCPKCVRALRGDEP
jgi:isoleucyl-tRNA synthetase